MIKELSVVIPIFNAAEWIDRTIERTEEAIREASIQTYEIIVIDDGSSDDTAKIVEKLRKKNKHIKLHVQENKGRFIARKQGVDRARYDRILFVDARTWIDKGSLKFLSKQIEKHPKRLVWNSHINVEKKGNIIARFGDVITLLGWRRYFKKPKLTSYGLEEFDYYPKGTGLFCVPTETIKEAIQWFESNTKDIRNSSDDTLLIRHIAEKNKIWLSPDYSGSYFARTTLPAFVKHTYDRGRFFVDGFMRPGTRFFYPLIAVLLFSLLCAIGIVASVILCGPLVLLSILGVIILSLLCAGGVAASQRITMKDNLSFLLLLPVFTAIYLTGIWRAVLDRNKMTRLAVQWLLKRRKFLHGSALEYLVIVGISFLTTCYVMDFIQFTGISHKIFASGPSDATSGFVWLNFADPGINPILGKTDFSNYPLGEKLGGLYFVTYILLWLPVRFFSSLFGPIAGINIVTSLGYMLSFTGMYWLMKRLTKSVAISLFGAYSLAFFPYAIAKGTSHLAYIFSVIFVAILAAFINFWLRPSRRSMLLLALPVVASLYFDGYHLLLTPVMLAGMIISGIIFITIMNDKNRMQEIVLRLKHLVVASLVVAAMCLPILLVGTVFSKQVNTSLSATRSPIAQEVPFYKSWPLDFIIPARNNPYFNHSDTYVSIQKYRNTRSDTLSNTSFIGYVTIILTIIGGLIGLWWLIVRKTKYASSSTLERLTQEEKKLYVLLTMIALVCGVLFVSFMLSPNITVHGIKIPLPGELLIKYNIGLWRNMSRFSETLQVVLVTFSMYVLWILLKYSKIYNAKYPRLVVGGLVLLLFIPTFITYANRVNFPEFDTENQGKALMWLKHQDKIKTVAYLPVVDPLDELSSNYSALQLVHGKKMINIKNPDYRVNSDVLGSTENTETIDWIRLRGADVAVVFYEKKGCPTVSWGKSIMWDPVWNICLYSIDKSSKPSVDKYFARIESGVNATPNYDPSEKNTYRLSSDTVRVDVADDNLQPYKNDSSLVNLSAKLFNWNYPNDSIGGEWSVYQGKKRIATGKIEGGTANIKARVVADEPVDIKITRQNNGNDLLLQDLKINR